MGSGALHANKWANVSKTPSRSKSEFKEDGMRITCLSKESNLYYIFIREQVTSRIYTHRDR